ncbi:hypothetical protein D3C87_1788160 [compost metagenome]
MRRQLADVAHHAEGGGSKLPHRVVHGSLPPAEDRDTRAFGHEGLGRGEADAAVATGDDSGLSREFAHVCSFMGMRLPLAVARDCASRAMPALLLAPQPRTGRSDQ